MIAMVENLRQNFSMPEISALYYYCRDPYERERANRIIHFSLRSQGGNQKKWAANKSGEKFFISVFQSKPKERRTNWSLLLLFTSRKCKRYVCFIINFSWIIYVEICRSVRFWQGYIRMDCINWVNIDVDQFILYIFGYICVSSQTVYTYLLQCTYCGKNETFVIDFYWKTLTANGKGVRWKVMLYGFLFQFFFPISFRLFSHRPFARYRYFNGSQ